ncbi:MAG: DUF1849 family protein [Pseudomonadota bacterium]
MAVYKLSLGKLHADRSISHASGQIEFELADACDGWTVEQRTRLVVVNAEGFELTTGWTFRAWESKDGLNYRFYTKRLHMNGSQEEVRGKATLKALGEGGIVTYSLPESREESLPPGALFPVMHGLELMRAASQDELLVWREVFDGASADGLFGINAAVLKALPAEAAPPLESELLTEMPSWRMRLAYFAPTTQAAEPDYEQGQRLYANGIVDELEFDYADFAISGELESLVALPPAEC